MLLQGYRKQKEPSDLRVFIAEVTSGDIALKITAWLAMLVSKPESGLNLPKALRT